MTISRGETKGVCHLAYDAVRGERYRFADGGIWSVLDHRANRLSGFKAIIIKPESQTRNVTVLAFAGTDSLTDVLVDIKQLFGGLPTQYTQAVRLAIESQGNYSNLHLSGHSLGGGLAAYASVRTGLSASTINPAPLVGAALRAPGAFGANRQIINYIPERGEIVSSSPGRNPGTDIRVPANGNYITRHMVANVMPDIPLPEKIGSGGGGR